MRILLRDAQLITCTATDPPSVRADVRIVDSRIDSVAERLSAQPDDHVLDCSGLTVLPGLIDAHVHVMSADVLIGDQHRHRFPSHVVVKAARHLGDYLARGFTAVRDAGGADPGLREAIAAGDIPGPRLTVSGSFLSQTGGHGDFRRPAEDRLSCCSHIGMSTTIADGVDAVRAAAREQLRRGVDHIKVMASGGAMSPGDALASTQYTVAEISAAVEEARAVGSYVLAHAYSPQAIRNSVEAGVRSIEHGNFIDHETASLMAQGGVFLVPTLATYDVIVREGANYGVPIENLDKMSEANNAAIDGLLCARDAGVRIASGSDLLGPLQSFATRELVLRAPIVGAYDALVAATRTNSELLRLDHVVGTIEVGKEADLLVVDGDPLEDISLLTDSSRVCLVFQAGRVVAQSGSLLHKPFETSDRPCMRSRRAQLL